MNRALRKYNAAATIQFTLIDFGTTDFEATPVTFAAGDVKVSKNGGAFANVGTLPTHVGNGVYTLSLTATEMSAARVVVTIVDQSGPKLWEDEALFIETYGNASALHPFDLGTAMSAQAVASVAGDVGGNVAGSVASVTGSVGSVTGSVGSVAGAVGSVTGNVGGSVGSVAAGGITAASIATDAIDADALADDAVAEIQSAVEAGSVASVVGSVGSVVGDVGGDVLGSVASVSGAVGSVTGNVGGSVASVTAGVTLTNAGVDAILNRALAESYAADGAAPTLAQALLMIQQLLGDFSYSGTTLTVHKLDGATTAATFTLDSATAASALTRAS